MEGMCNKSPFEVAIDNSSDSLTDKRYLTVMNV